MAILVEKKSEIL